MPSPWDSKADITAADPWTPEGNSTRPVTSVTPVDEPEPIKESVVFDGHNHMQVADWAFRTLDHYEIPDTAITISRADGQFTVNDVNLQAGQVLTFSDRDRQFRHGEEQWVDRDGVVPPGKQFDHPSYAFNQDSDGGRNVVMLTPEDQALIKEIQQQGPEILAQDHPLTVAEAGLIRGAAAEHGVVPESGEVAFVRRRAEQLFPVPEELQASMNRHPSAAARITPPAPGPEKGPYVGYTQGRV